MRTISQPGGDVGSACEVTVDMSGRPFCHASANLAKGSDDCVGHLLLRAASAEHAPGHRECLEAR